MGQGLQALYRPAGSGQNVAIGAGSVATTNVLANGMTQGAAGICGVLLFSTVDCWVEINTGPTAVSGTSTFLAANTYLPLKADPNDKVAVIQDSAAGTLRVRPLAEG